MILRFSWLLLHINPATIRDKNEIYQLIKNDLNNNDHLMIKASNSTGLNSVALNIKKGKIYAV